MFSPALRQPAVAGRFYPAAPAELHTTVDRLIAAAPVAHGAQPKALIVPHAGYVYSGATAAAAYARLSPWADSIRHVVLVGPAHHAAVQGVALPAAQRFATPLGEVPVAVVQVEALDALPQVTISDFPHQAEHALEVQLPFLQTVLHDFDVLPMLTGRVSAQEVASVLEVVWGGDDTLIVVSSDLSHYLPQDVARVADQITLETIVRRDPALIPEQACGNTAINALLIAARQHGLVAELIARTDSGPVSAREDSVVGYAAIALLPPPAVPRDAAERGHALTALARAAVAAAVGAGPEPTAPSQGWLAQPGASFVTLHDASGALRGCVGGLHARAPLAEDVMSHARAAALRDPRFAPLTRGELDGLHIEVSVLSPLEPLSVRSEDELAALLRPGVDGLVLEAGAAHATFLPQVWEQLPAAHAFIRQLKAKAGVVPDAWNPTWRWQRYTVEAFEEAHHAAG